MHIQQFHSVSIGWHSHYSVSNPLVNTTISYTILCYIAFYIIFVKIYCGHLLKLKLLSFSRTVRWNSFVRFSTAINEIFAHKLLAQVLSHTYFGPFSAATQHIIAYFHLVPGASFFLFGWMEWPQHLSWIWHWISVFSWHGFWNPENRPFKVDRNPPPSDIWSVMCSVGKNEYHKQHWRTVSNWERFANLCCVSGWIGLSYRCCVRLLTKCLKPEL